MKATVAAPARLEYVRTVEGVRQGAHLSCLLCGVGGKRAQLAAEKALDE